MADRKLKILFVCTVNRMISATAQKIYENDNRFEVKSAGTDITASKVVTRDLLNWSDAIVVMENIHRNFIMNKYPDIYNYKKVVSLNIPDEYYFMEPELIKILKEKFEDAYQHVII